MADDSFFYTGDPGTTDSFDPSVMGDPSNYGALDLSTLLQMDPGYYGPGGAPVVDQSTQAPTSGPNAPVSGIGSLLGGLASALGLHPSQLLPLLLAGGGALFGGLNARNATGQATQDITNAYNKANSQITSILGNGNSAFLPYMTLGNFATQGLQNLGTSPIAQNFRPLGGGRGVVTLGQLGGH